MFSRVIATSSTSNAYRFLCCLFIIFIFSNYTSKPLFMQANCMGEMYYNSRNAIRKTARSVRRCFAMYIVTIHGTPFAKPHVPCAVASQCTLLQFTRRPFAKPHVPCAVANRKQGLRATLFCSWTGVHFVMLICQISMQAWNLSRSSMTREL